MTNSITKVEFRGDSLSVINKNGEQYVAIRPICEAMGLDWSKQYRTLTSDPVLATCVATVAAQLNNADQSRNYVCLPLSFLNGWLLRLNANNFAEPKRSRIIAYQRDCYNVLYKHFVSDAAHRAAIGATDDVLMANFKKTETQLRQYAARLRFELRQFCRRFDLDEASCAKLLAQSFQYGPSTVGGLYDFGVWDCAEVPDEYFSHFYRRCQSPTKFGGLLNEVLKGKYLPGGES